MYKFTRSLLGMTLGNPISEALGCLCGLLLGFIGLWDSSVIGLSILGQLGLKNLDWTSTPALVLLMIPVFCISLIALVIGAAIGWLIGQVIWILLMLLVFVSEVPIRVSVGSFRRIVRL